MSIVTDSSKEFDKKIEHFRTDIASLKTGRANPSVLDNVMVDAYGGKMPINQLGSIGVPESRCMLIQPWDKSVIKDIEKAIIEANLGFSPVNEGDKIRINLPLMTEESRKEIAKTLHKKIEDARISVRTVREEIKDEIMKAAEEKKFGEDEKFTLLEDLDKKVAEYNDKIKKIGEEKEEEIMTI